ncbi:unnamed protein product, partial [Urochloa humidicola]
ALYQFRIPLTYGSYTSLVPFPPTSLSAPATPPVGIVDLMVTIAARRPSSTSPPTASFPALVDPNNHTGRVLVSHWYLPIAGPAKLCATSRSRCGARGVREVLNIRSSGRHRQGALEQQKT